MARKVSAAGVLDRLEEAYGHLVDPGDPIEAGVLALLAAHAPKLAQEKTRDALRESFVDWNEARVADPWDVTNAIGAGGDAEARAFARALLRFLASFHNMFNRVSFDLPPSEQPPDIAVALTKMRGAPAYVVAVVLAARDPEGGWHPVAETVKAAQAARLAPRTTSAPKVAKALADAVPPQDRLRAHYLLTRYGMREKDAPDPLAEGAPKPAKKAVKAPKAVKKATSRSQGKGA